jgi:hypothetical protein
MSHFHTEAITRFVRDFTVHVDGIGDVCSLACFDLHRHGNAKYGSPVTGKKVRSPLTLIPPAFNSPTCPPGDCLRVWFAVPM